MFKNTDEIIKTLEKSFDVFDDGQIERAKLMVAASKQAIQIHILDFSKMKFNNRVPKNEK